MTRADQNTVGFFCLTSPKWHFPRTSSGNVTLISGRLIRICCVAFARFPQPSRTSHIRSIYCTQSFSYMLSTYDNLIGPLLLHSGATITFGSFSFFFTSAGQPLSRTVSRSRMISGGSVTKSSSIRPRENRNKLFDLISYFTWRRQNIFTNGILPCRRPSMILVKT